MKDQHLSENEIAQAAEFLLDNKYAKLDDSIRKHLKECDDCASEVEFMMAMINGEKRVSRPLPVIKILSYAAAASVIVALFVIFSPDDTPEDSIQDNMIAQTDNGTETTDSAQLYTNLDIDTVKTTEEGTVVKEVVVEKPVNIKKSDNDILYAEAAELEKLVARFDSADRSSDIKILSPHVFEVKSGEEVKLIWENSDEIELQIELFNNKGELINNYSTVYDNIVIENLEKGVYYWKLINEDFDLLFCGKIIIKP